MCDDLTNDADTRTLDQCLNCSRYEPILGQFYEITGDNPGMAQIYDDVQASRMTKEEFAKINHITDHSEMFERPEEDLTGLHLRAEGEKGYDELLDEADNFVMNWTETPYHKQSPHINNYKYDPYDIYRNKPERIEKVYEDGWREQTQMTFQRPQYNMNTVGGGNFNPVTSEVDGLNGLYHIRDYDLKEDDVRLKIIATCEEAVALGQQEKILFTYGAQIQDEFLNQSPKELVKSVEANKAVNKFLSGRGNDDLSHRAVYFDSASFASYVYIYCDILRLVGFSVNSLKSHYGFHIIPNNNAPLLEQMTQAYPGDLLLYKNHVSIYAGEDYQYEAKDDKLTKSADQICKSKIRDANDFIGIYRHKDLSTPSIKNKADILIKATLDEYVDIQVGKNVGRDTNGDGYIEYAKDGDWLKDKTVLRNYIDPKKRLTPELKMQFASIRNLKTPGIITEDTINDFLLRVGGKATKKVMGIKVDAQYNPVRDEDGNLVWEEKYAFPRGDVWLAAAQKSDLNPLFLMVHCAGETGWCVSSNWTNYSGDYRAKNSDDYLFNAFGIWCYDSEYFPNEPSLHRVTAKRKTEENQWFSLEKSIVEGAKWIKDQYLSNVSVSKYGRRDTTYFMKWHMGNLIEGQNPKSSPGTMQYATDVSWADQRAKMLYNALKNSPVGREEALKHFEYFIPEFIDNTFEKVESKPLKSLGDFTITYYCGCQKCNGKWYGMPSANGEPLKANYTIAVDPDVIPLNTWVEIEGIGKRKACDTGSAIKGKRIDVYLEDHDECYRKGKHTAEVFLVD